MKKVIFALFSISLLFFSCAKDEETPKKPIDKFIGSFEGNLNEYTCATSQVLLSTLSGAKVKLNKDSDTNFNGTLSDDKGVKLFGFTGTLESGNDNKIRIAQFIYNADTLFGGGELVSGKLNLNLAAKSCPNGENVFSVTRTFIQQ